MSTPTTPAVTHWHVIGHVEDDQIHTADTLFDALGPRDGDGTFQIPAHPPGGH